MSADDFDRLAFLVTMLSMLLAGIVYILFGQVTVRKLRKNPATRDCLGMEFLHGGDIAHVAQAFGWPRRLQERAERGGLSFMVAKYEVLRQHTNRVDRALGWVCYWSAMLCGVILLGFCLLVSRH